MKRIFIIFTMLLVSLACSIPGLSKAPSPTSPAVDLSTQAANPPEPTTRASGVAPTLGLPLLFPSTATSTLSPATPDTGGTSITPVAPTPGMVTAVVPTNTPTVEAKPAVQINLDNASKMQLVQKLGEGDVKSMIWSPDGARLFVLSSNSLACYETAATRTVWQAEPDKDYSLLGLSADGSSLVTGTWGGATQNWDATSGQRQLAGVPQLTNAGITTMTLDGKLIATTDHRGITTIRDTTDGKVVTTNNGQSFPLGLTAQTLSADGSTFTIIGYDSQYNHMLQQWEVGSNKFLHGLKGYDLDVYDVLYSTDGTLVGGYGESASGNQHAIFIWETRDGTLLGRITLTRAAERFVISPDNKSIAVAYYDGSMEIFTIADGSSMGVFNGNSSGIASLAFSPDGGSIASAGWDNTIQTWNVSSGQVDQVLYQSQNSSPISTFRKVAFSPDGKLAAVSNYGEAISLIDALSGQKVSTTGNASGDYGAMAFDPEGKRLAAVSNNTNVDILDLASGNTLAQIPTIHNKPIQKLKFSPDGNTLATLSTEQLYLWNVQTGKKAWDLAGFNAFDYSPDGKILVSDSSDYGLYVWNTATGRQIAAPAAEYIEGLHYSPDGSRIAVVGWQVQSREKEHINLVYFVDAAEPKKRLPVKMTGLFREPREVEFSPDGTMLATSDSYGNIYIFDVIKGTQLALFEETGTLVYTLFFTPDQTTLIAASGDGALLYFQVRE